MEGIVDYNVGGAHESSASSPINKAASESRSHSDHSLHNHPDFNDPKDSPQDQRKEPNPIRASLKTTAAPLPPTANEPMPASDGTDNTESPVWAPPESWPMETGAYVEIDSEPEVGPSSLMKTRASSTRTMEERLRKNSRNPGRDSFSSTATSKPDPMYRMRIYRPNQNYHIIAMDLKATVGSLTFKLNRKLEDTARFHTMYLEEQGRERILDADERPAKIVKLRMQQAGYDEEDGMQLLGPESLGMLVKFQYKSQLLAGEDQLELQNHTSIDLSGKGLRTITPLIYKIAEEILTLRLSRNPMTEIPLDFIQSCTNLRDLQLTHMSMKKLPQSLRHSSSLRRLDISSNSISELTEAKLHEIEGLIAIFASNNCLYDMPEYLDRMFSLTTLNISNNKFQTFPPALLTLKNLHDLDISFNMITELPEEIGTMQTLEKLVIVGNRISHFPNDISRLTNLGYLDCRRNQISNLSPVCMLAKLRHLSADHNMVHNLNLSLGPHFATLIASHNDITQITLVQGPHGNLPFSLSALDLSYARISVLDDSIIGQLSVLRTLRLDHNTLCSIPDSIGDLKWLETLSCAFNKLDTLPNTIGKLQKLETLEAHSNNLSVLPQSIWNCTSLVKINLSSNYIATWIEPPAPPVPDITISDGSGHIVLPIVPPRKASLAGISPMRYTPPLVYSLEQLFLGENLLSDSSILPLMLFKQLRVLNLSYNEIRDLPLHFFKGLKHLQELHLSGNKLTNLPVEDFDRLKNLSVIYLNGNKLQTLPQELGNLPNLTVLDVGSNVLKYNIHNYEFDWNWNFNPSIKFLNFSGNKRLQIKGESPTNARAPRQSTQMSGFTKLNQLKVLGLMDVTVTMFGHGVVDIPDENADRRVRTSHSEVCGMSYGMADSMGSKDNFQYMLDLVHEFPADKVAMFAMFGSTQPPVGLRYGSSPNRISKYLHDNFVNVFKAQLVAVGNRGSASASIIKALHWTYLKLNQDLYELLLISSGKNSQASLEPNAHLETQYSRTGVSAVSVYFADRALYAANVGDALAVVSRRGVHHSLSRKHDPYDPEEIARIRAADGFVSPSSLVSDEVDVSRAFGYYHLFPRIIARPNIQQYDLIEGDEFVIIANRGLWDYMSPKTAVDVARTVTRTTGDPMMAAAKLRDFAMSYGADGSTMVMVIWVADLFQDTTRSRQ
ncbi:hypothetical protein D9619_011577 [Psilocybe cf. subviscida]|uniref:PPM-type phosphatase domain-containing protein n=1 Tax=Psilocybe cf. subviscida TaxID=2480587 RepID=A0A8H5BS71_9AGAR|nr:hypothetical protein D9619_011577 [Psilocybe cf. subviscida]